jgi:hypothetical protein
MANLLREAFFKELRTRTGSLKKLDRSQSLYEIGNGSCILYIRYSKVHERNSTFYGLRQEDLRLLYGRSSLLCFLWAGQEQPVLVPFADFEDVFQSISPAGDGQYKAQIYIRNDVIELNIVGAGRFNLEAYVGWQELDHALGPSKVSQIPEFSHAQVQTLIGSIGKVKGYDIYIPPNDRNKLDWTLTRAFDSNAVLPLELD